MKQIRFYTQVAEKFLIESGYRIGKNGCMVTGYILEDPRGRFHARLEGKDENTIILHYDRLINGYHKVDQNALRLTKEKKRILKKVHKIARNNVCYFCENCKLASGDGDGFVGKKCNLIEIK